MTDGGLRGRPAATHPAWVTLTPQAGVEKVALTQDDIAGDCQVVAYDTRARATKIPIEGAPAGRRLAALRGAWAMIAGCAP